MITGSIGLAVLSAETVQLSIDPSQDTHLETFVLNSTASEGAPNEVMIQNAVTGDEISAPTPPTYVIHALTTTT